MREEKTSNLFKEGDVVRILDCPSIRRWEFGDMAVGKIGTITGISSDGEHLLIDDNKYEINFHAHELELANKFKVGDKVRVIGYRPEYSHGETLGWVGIVNDHSNGIPGDVSVLMDDGEDYFYLPEHLDLVEKEKESSLPEKVYFEGDFLLSLSEEEILNILMSNPIKNSLKEKTMSYLRSIPAKIKRILNVNYQAFYKLGWVDSELDLTSEGKTALLDILLSKNEKELGDVARKQVRDLKKKAKSEDEE